MTIDAERVVVDDFGEYICCQYNTGVECGVKYCPRNCGWRPQIAHIRKRQLNGGKGLKDRNGLRYLPVRNR